MTDYTVYSSSDYVESLDYAIDILEALTVENVLVPDSEAQRNIRVLQDLKRVHDTRNLPN